MGNPELLLPDEPSQGLAPLIVRAAPPARRRPQVDRPVEKGEVRLTGTPADLQADERIVHQFLTV